MTGRGRHRRRGMVTAELAVGLLVAVLVTMMGAWTVNLIAVEATCRDVATQVARQMARGDEDAAAAAGRRAPSGASVDVNRAGDEVRVLVRVDRSLGRIGPVRLAGTAVAVLEPGVSP